MRTQIVYTLISEEKDIFLEQALVSAYSCRLHNPDAKIILIVDDATNRTLIGKRAEINKYISQKIVIECPQTYSNKEKSRYLKTSIRQNITGDFLFIDCDTIVCDSLAEIDDINADVAMVPDTHVRYREYPFYHYMNDVLMQLYGINVSQDEYYFNSGAMLVRNTPLAHQLFCSWNQYWQEARKKGITTDQQALFKVNHDMGNVIQLLPGIYNCQIGLSVQYLYEAKILHYFNSQMLKNTDFSPFFLRSFYEKVKTDGEITLDTAQLIRTAKSQFSSPTLIVSRTEMNFLMCATGRCMMNEFIKQGFIYKLISFILKAHRKLKLGLWGAVAISLFFFMSGYGLVTSLEI